MKKLVALLVLSLAAVQAVAQQKPAWQAPFPAFAADFIRFVDARRFLVGLVELGAAEYDAPRYGKVALHDAATGQKIWETERRGGLDADYGAIAIPSAVVLLASRAGELDLTAFDPASGAQRWRRSLKAPAHLEPMEDGSVLALWLDGSRFRLASLDGASGRELWTRALEEPQRPRAGVPGLHVDGEDLFVVGAGFTRLARDGAVKHAAPLAGFEGGAADSLRAPGAVWAWDTAAMAVLGDDGRPRWQHAVQGGAILQVVHGDALGYRVLAKSDATQAAHTIQAVDAATGHVVWSHEAPGSLASALLVTDGLLVFTLDDAIVGLDAKSGAARFRTAFPYWFHQATPNAVGAQGQRDLLQARDGTVHVARERGGVAAFRFAGGVALWAQASYEIMSGIHPMYSTVASSTRVRGLVRASGVPSLPHNFYGLDESAFYQASIRSSEQRVQNMEVERVKALRQGATGRAIFLSNAQSVEASMQRFSGQLAVANSILNATWVLRDFIAKAVVGHIFNASIAPQVLAMRNAGRLHKASLQDGYYVRPFNFYGQGRGFTIVDLASGKRADVFHTPAEVIPTLVDLPAFALSGAAAPRLHTVGLGHDASRHEFQVVRAVKLPRPSLLAYDLRELPFVERNERLETFLAGLPAAWKTGVGQWAGHCNTFHVRQGLDGADSATQAGVKDAALIFAAMDGCIDVIRFALERGANVNAVNAGGRTPLDLAPDEPTRQFLTKAGGRSAKAR